MDQIFQKLSSLPEISNQIILYKSDAVNIMKGIGKIVGKFDSELLEFLKFTNGASIFDYCFMGFKNSRLGNNIDKYAWHLWASHDFLAGRFLPFATTSISDNFGYLIDIVDDKGRHPIAYYSSLLGYDDSIYIIGSSFQEFMKTFLLDIDDAIKNSDGDFIVNIEKEGWPVEINHWLANDSILAQKQSEIHETLRKYMPSDVKIF